MLMHLVLCLVLLSISSLHVIHCLACWLLVVFLSCWVVEKDKFFNQTQLYWIKRYFATFSQTVSAFPFAQKICLVSTMAKWPTERLCFLVSSQNEISSLGTETNRNSRCRRWRWWTGQKVIMADSVVKAVLLGFNCRHASKNVFAQLKQFLEWNCRLSIFLLNYVGFLWGFRRSNRSPKKAFLYKNIYKIIELYRKIVWLFVNWVLRPYHMNDIMN